MCLGFGDEFIAENALLANELIHQWFKTIKLMGGYRNGAAND